MSTDPKVVRPCLCSLSQDEAFSCLKVSHRSDSGSSHVDFKLHHYLDLFWIFLIGDSLQTRKEVLANAVEMHSSIMGIQFKISKYSRHSCSMCGHVSINSS